jgi:hypothetical protein
MLICVSLGVMGTADDSGGALSGIEENDSDGLRV